MINIIVAMAKNRVIGSKNDLPWRISEDLEYFEKTTTNHPCIMGKNTLISLGLDKEGKQRILKNRTNIMLSPDNDNIENVITVNSIEEALDTAKQSNGNDEIFICGGGSVYKTFLEKNLVYRIYLTYIDEEVIGEIYFPELPKYFKLESEKKRIVRVNDKEIRYSFQIYIRTN